MVVERLGCSPVEREAEVSARLDRDRGEVQRHALPHVHVRHLGPHVPGVRLPFCPVHRDCAELVCLVECLASVQRSGYK